MAKKQWFSYVLFYLLWTVLIALGFWFFILSRETVDIVLAYYAGDDFTRFWRAGFLDKVFSLFMGLVVLVFIYATEGYLRAGIEKNDMLRRFFKTTGLMLLMLFVMDLVLLLLQQFTGGVWLRWVVLIAELGLGAGFFWIGRRRASAKPTGSVATTDHANPPQS